MTIPHAAEPDAGIADFRILRENGSCYVDKTAHLPQLLRGRGPLLLTRPRRFGKTLTLDTLRCFLELNYQNPGNTALQERLFAGLDIMEDPALQECRERHMGQYPVLALSFNTVEGESFEEALTALRSVICTLFKRFEPVLMGSALSASDRAVVQSYLDIRQVHDHQYLMPLLRDAPQVLAELLYSVYSRSVYILLDEYDTPLAKAWSREYHPLPHQDPQAAAGYYPAMLNLMRGLLQPLLKPQPALSGAIARCILSGCLQISQESIFSGANNLSVLSMRHHRCATLMGFTRQEVHELLASLGLEAMGDAVRQWYDGYTIGGTEHIYNPWSVVSYCHDAPGSPDPTPRSYWANTSGNEVLSSLADELSEEGLRELQVLLQGGTLQMQVREGLTYTALSGLRDDDAFFSLLYHSGYLTGTPVPGTGELRLRIPNVEVQRCYALQLQGYFGMSARRDAASFATLLTQLADADADQAQLTLTALFTRHLGLQQMQTRDDGRCSEVIYQLLVHLGLDLLGTDQVRFCAMEQPAGEGRCDECLLFARHQGLGCILEFKVARRDSDEALEQAARQAVAQIASRRYAEGLISSPQWGIRRVLAYGIGCIRKRCRMVLTEYGA